MGSLDLNRFAGTFFPHYCRLPGSFFHSEMYDLLGDAVTGRQASRIAVAAPRESAKSTLATLFLPIWCICYPKILGRRYILIASDTAAQAERNIADIKDELEGNSLLAEAFPECCGATDHWRSDEIITASGVKITARGTGGNIRGLRHGPWRPDLLIGDDLENDTNARSGEGREKIVEWFFKAFSKSASRDSAIIVIGTILHRESLLSRLLENPAYESRKYRGVISWSEETALWESWEIIFTNRSLPDKERLLEADVFFETHRERMLAGTKVIWPEHRSYYDMMKLRVTEGPASFDSEIQNEPVNPERCLFQPEWFRYFEERELDVGSMIIVAAVDPSLGGSGDRGDPSAIVCLGVDENGIIFVLDADITRRNPDTIIEDTIELYQRRKPAAIGVETVQFQEFFREVLTRTARERGLYPPVQGIKSSAEKALRIQRLQPLVKNGTIRFRKRHHTLLEQLRYYPLAGHDDGPDALEMAVQMTEKVTRTGDLRFGGPLISGQHLKRIFG